MSQKQIKPGRRLRKQLAKYGVKHNELREEVFDTMADYVDTMGGKAIDNFKRYDNKLWVAARYLIDEPTIIHMEFIITFEVLPIKSKRGKEAGWLDIKITNMKEDK